MKKRFGGILAAALLLLSGCADSAPAEDAVLLDVPFIDQRIKYPTGCECVSAVMALQYLGYEISVDTFIDEYMERGELPRDTEEGPIGPDPDQVFLGNPYTSEGYGCYAGAIQLGLERYLEENRPADTGSGEEAGADSQENSGAGPEANSGAASQENIGAGPEANRGEDSKEGSGAGPEEEGQAGPPFHISKALREVPVEELAETYLDQGIPVILWVGPSSEEDLRPEVWTEENSGKKITWNYPEHCVLLVGYDAERYYFNDPSGGKQRAWDREETESRYANQFSQAVVILPQG